MKDQFANYVVQKILETCNNRQQEILLRSITVHLQALKKYTYGKHIVARVEQLCGEGTCYSASYRFFKILTSVILLRPKAGTCTSLFLPTYPISSLCMLLYLNTQVFFFFSCFMNSCLPHLYCP